jgi:hypothetical protein
VREDGFVFVDPHILCNPAIGDIDADGHDELVVAVSYFFDQEYYSDPVRPLASSATQTARFTCLLNVHTS